MGPRSLCYSIVKLFVCSVFLIHSAGVQCKFSLKNQILQYNFCMQMPGLTREKRCGWGLLLLWGDSRGEEGEGEEGEEGDGDREEVWREDGDRLRSMAGGVKQDPCRSWEEDWESTVKYRVELKSDDVCQTEGKSFCMCSFTYFPYNVKF